MSKDMSYAGVMLRRPEIMKQAAGLDFSVFESGSIAFDYERMMREAGFTIEEIRSFYYINYLIRILKNKEKLKKILDNPIIK